MKMRKALPLPAAIPVLFLAPAYSGEAADSGGKTPKPSQKSAQSAQEKDSAEAKRLLGALDTPALEKAVLTGTVTGMEAKKIAEAEVEAGRVMDADRKEYRPLAGMIGGFTPLTPVATAPRSLQSAKATDFQRNPPRPAAPSDVDTFAPQRMHHPLEPARNHTGERDCPRRLRGRDHTRHDRDHLHRHQPGQSQPRKSFQNGTDACGFQGASSSTSPNSRSM